MRARVAKFTILGAIAAAAAFIAAAPQSASALSFKYDGQLNGSANVQYTRGAPPGAEVKNGNSSAGVFSFTDQDGDLGAFLAWCFDVDTNISTGPHEYTQNNGLLNNINPPYLLGAKERVQNLFDKSYDPDDILGDDAKSAGFQIAIWEVLYDNNFDITEGTFKVTGGNAAAQSAATTFLTGVELYDGDQRWILTTYDSDDSQDIGVATAIPLPAAAWLLLGVSGALVAAKRRSARKAA